MSPGCVDRRKSLVVHGEMFHIASGEWCWARDDLWMRDFWRLSSSLSRIGVGEGRVFFSWSFLLGPSSISDLWLEDTMEAKACTSHSTVMQQGWNKRELSFCPHREHQNKLGLVLSSGKPAHLAWSWSGCKDSREQPIVHLQQNSPRPFLMFFIIRNLLLRLF